MDEPTVKNPNLGYLKALKIFGILSILLALGCAGLLAIAKQNSVKAIDKELAKAKAAGMLTSVQDIETMLGPRPSEADNATSNYKTLSDYRERPEFSVISRTRQALLENPSKESISDAKQLLAENSRVMKAAVEAGKKSKFRYDHDWSQGYFMFESVYGYINNVAHLLIIRSLVHKLEDRDDLAMADIRTVKAICSHLNQDVSEQARSFSVSIAKTACLVLANYAALEPPESNWMKELEEFERSIKVPLFQELAAFDLVMDLTIFEAIKSREQRAKLMGSEATRQEGFVEFLRGQVMPADTGLLEVIKARVEIYEELAKEESVNWGKINKADERINQSVTLNPHLKVLFVSSEIADTSVVKGRRDSASDSKTLIQAAIRVLRQKDRRKMPSFSDLISPIDGLPIRGAVVGDSVVLSSVDTPQTAMPRRTFSFRIRD